MKVPDTETFTLVDVYNSVGSHAIVAGNLTDCFAKSVTGFFDPAYNNNTYAAASSMKRFRNYTPFVSPPTQGQTILENPFGVKVNGRSIYVDKNGNNLFLLVQVEGDQPGVARVLRYTLAIPFHVNTATYHSSVTLSGGIASGLYRHRLYFTDDGTHMFVSLSSSTSTLANPDVETYVMSTAWNINGGTTRYVTTLQHNKTFSQENLVIAFAEGLGVVSVTGDGFGNTQFAYFTNTSLKQIKNLTSVNVWRPVESNIGDPVGQLGYRWEARLNTAAGLFYGSIRASNGNYWVYRWSYSIVSGNIQIYAPRTLYVTRLSNTFSYLADFHHIDDRKYLYALQDNLGFSGETFPKITTYVIP